MAHTASTVPASPGDHEIETNDTLGFALGDKVFIDKDKDNEESVVVSGFGSLVFENPLTKAHPEGATVDIDESQITGSSATLDETGYAAVAALRCATQMMAFVMRVAEELGFDVCDEGGLAGFSIWFDTPEDGKTYAALESELPGGATTNCAFLVASGVDCTPLPSTCPSYPAAELPPCGA